MDLLDLYTHHRVATLVGPDHALDTFIAVRINLNQEASTSNFPRYTEWIDAPTAATPGANDSKKTAKPTNGTTATATPNSISPQSPSRGSGSVGERGKDGTVRFMLDAVRAKDEKNVVKEYFRAEEFVEEYVY